MEVMGKGKAMSKVNKEAMHIIKCFTSYKPKEGADIIRYLYKARELANCYDKLVQCEDIEQENNTTTYMQYLLQMCPFYKDLHI